MIKQSFSHPKSLPQKWYQSVALFIFLFCAQQLIIIAFNIGFHINPIDGLIAGVMVTALILCYLAKYQVIRQPLPKNISSLKGGTFSVIALSIIATYLMQITWALASSQILQLQLNGHHSGNQNNIMNYFQHGPIAGIFIALIVILIAPAIEEFIFRVLIIKPQATSKYQGFRIVSSLGLFAFAHMITQINQIPWNHWCFYFGQYLVIGLTLTWLYAHYRNYWLNYFTHAGWNTISLIIALL